MMNYQQLTLKNYTFIVVFLLYFPGLQQPLYGDKGYCVAPAVRTARAKGCHLAAVKKNNMKGKDPDKDRWYTKIRAPYERVFSQRNRRVRYKGIAKNQFAAFMSAICFNLKRLIVLDLPDLHLT